MADCVLVIVSVSITILTALYFVLWILGNRSGNLSKGLIARSYPFKVLYLFGFEVLARTGYSYRTRYDRKMYRCFSVLYGRKHAAYHQQISLARKISVSVLVFILLLLLSIVLNAWIALLFAFAGAAGIVYYYDADTTQRLEKRRENIRRDFPEVLTSLALLVNAGLIVDKAWKMVSKAGDGLLYQEMRRASVLIDNGVSPNDAWMEFAERCSEPYVDKIISALLQNLSRGNSELVIFLKRISDESWNEQKHAARRKGETASARMLFPIMLIFLGILIMVMLPITTNAAL